MTSENLKSLTASLRHALAMHAQDFPTPDPTTAALLDGVDRLIRAAVNHGGPMRPLAAAYWMEWVECMDASPADGKAFVSGAVQMEEAVGVHLEMSGFPLEWISDDGDD